VSASRPKPLSPHLQIFRWPLTMALSILHRITGAALSVGLVLLVVWLAAVAAGPEAFAVVDGIVDSWLGVVVMLGFTIAAFLHFANGIRHLAWDFGWGYEPATTRKSGIAVLVFTGAATVVTWLAIAIAA